jgi:hypothetical protein
MNAILAGLEQLYPNGNQLLFGGITRLQLVAFIECIFAYKNGSALTFLREWNPDVRIADIPMYQEIKMDMIHKKHQDVTDMSMKILWIRARNIVHLGIDSFILRMEPFLNQKDNN